MLRFSWFVCGLLYSLSSFSGTCRVDQVRYSNIDIEEISRRYRVDKAETFTDCLQKSLDGQLRGTSYLVYSENQGGQTVSYLLYFGKVKNRF